MHDDNVLLRVENLSQHFGQLKAVDNISFDIKKGEVFGLVGESGCGKTTTGRSIIKLYDATGGNVYYKGRRIVAGTLMYKEAIAQCKAQLATDIAQLKKENPTDYKQRVDTLQQAARQFIAQQKQEIKKAKHDQKYCDKDYAKLKTQELKEEYLPKIQAEQDAAKNAALTKEYKEKLRIYNKHRLVNGIQMIFQDSIASLNPRMTVREIISEGLIIHGIRDKKFIDEQVYEVLERVGLVREHAGRYPHEFSGGQRQRIGISRSIIMNPDLIIADEPISALDVSIQAQVINLLNDLCQELGLTILFIAHDLSVVKYFSDRIGVMYYGKMVELASSEELFTHPLHPYTISLLSDIPRPDPLTERTRKRLVYNNLRDHDYSKEQPSFQEVVPGHFVMCNGEELERYRAEVAKIDAEKSQANKGV